MRIGIDARFFGSVGKGLGRYTQKLIENLEKIDTENEYFVFLRAENFEEYQPKNNNFKKVLADYHWYTFSEQVNMPRLLNKYSLDIVHFPHFNVPLFYRKKFIITIHDLILIHFPTIRGTTLNPMYYWFKFLAYKIVIHSAIKRAESIIAVSNFTKKDILGNYRVPEEKISVTCEACEDFCNISRENSGKILGKYGIMKPYILYVGNAYPHKNLEKLILGFAKNNQAKLVLVGKEDYFYKQLKKLTEDKNIGNVIFTGYVPDNDLDVIYRFSELYVFPSLYEGFGLPPLEAMAKGTPVVSSDHPCMKEILGNSAYYFNGENEEDMIEAIETVMTDEVLRKKLIANGYEQIKKYNWRKMAGDTLKQYNSSVNEEK